MHNSPFDLEFFTLRLLADALFFEPEEGILGQVSLVDGTTQSEKYLAYLDVERETYIVEEATAWEEEEPATDEEYRYAIAGKLEGIYASVDKTATVLLSLARRHHLYPSFLLLSEDMG